MTDDGGLGGSETIEVDGSVLEGGGQILRISFSLAALMRRRIRITRIRQNRTGGPGLKSQHLSGVVAVATLHGYRPQSSSVVLEGAVLKSTELCFTPGEFCAPRSGTLDVTVGTAGSIALVVQVTLPCVMFAPLDSVRDEPVVLRITGGTNVSASPFVSYLQEVFVPTLARLTGCSVSLETKRLGYFPKGGGECTLSVTPVKSLPPLTLLDRGTVTSVRVRAAVARMPTSVAHRMAEVAEQTIKKGLPDLAPSSVKAECVDLTSQSFGTGAWVEVVAETSTGCLLCGSAICERGKPAEDAGKEAASHLLEDLRQGGCVDEYLQDQLIVFMVLATGLSKIRAGSQLSLHTKTAIHIAQLVSGATFHIDQQPDGTNIISCQGISFQSPQQ